MLLQCTSSVSNFSEKQTYSGIQRSFASTHQSHISANLHFILLGLLAKLHFSLRENMSLSGRQGKMRREERSERLDSWKRRIAVCVMMHILAASSPHASLVTHESHHAAMLNAKILV